MVSAITGSQGMVTLTVTFPLLPLRKPASFFSSATGGSLQSRWGNLGKSLPAKSQHYLSRETRTSSWQHEDCCRETMTPLSTPWVWAVSVRCKGHNYQMSPSRQIHAVPVSVTLRRSLGGLLLGRGVKRLFVPSVTFAFLTTFKFQDFP